MIKNLNHLIDYIEAHLTEDFSIEELAKIIGVSTYHLKRTFTFIAGMSLFDYIKNRRLASANIDLINGTSVTEVAFKYGYQSVDGFSRAFRDWSGCLPSTIYQSKQQKSFPRLTFFIDVKGGNSMNFKLETKPAFNLVGVQKTVPIQFEGESNEIQALAQSITPQQREEMHALGNLAPLQVVNASYQFDDERLAEKGTLTHAIGFLTTKENSYADLTQLSIPSYTWAIFPNEGPFPSTLQNTWKNIFGEWLPTADYELVDAPEISFTQFKPNETSLYSEIWIAVKQKKA